MQNCSTSNMQNCSICLTPNDTPCALSPCGHTFCIDCITAFMKSAANNKRCPQCQGIYVHVMPLTNLCDTFEGKDEQVKMLRDIIRNDSLKNTLEENNQIQIQNANNRILEANYQVQFEMYNQNEDIIIGHVIDTPRFDILLWMHNNEMCNNATNQNVGDSITLWNGVKRFLRKYFYTL